MRMTIGHLDLPCVRIKTSRPRHGQISMNRPLSTFLHPTILQLATRCVAVVLAACVLLLVAGSTFAAAEPEEVYLPLFNLIQQGDFLKNQNQPELAMTKYQQALDGLRRFQINYPTFNPRMIAYRSNDVAVKIAGLNSNGVAEADSGTAKNAAASSSGG